MLQDGEPSIGTCKLTFDKGAENHPRRKGSPSHKWCEDNRGSIFRKIKFVSITHSTYKNQLKINHRSKCKA